MDSMDSMDSMDEFDVRESFDALDDEKLGLISFDTFYILYLGLGFPKMTKKELKRESNLKFFSVEAVLNLLSNKPRDRSSEISSCFSLVDREKKGYITAQDIENLSQEVGSPISTVEAKAMLSQSQASRLRANDKLSEQDFCKIMSPPSPQKSK